MKRLAIAALAAMLMPVTAAAQIPPVGTLNLTRIPATTSLISSGGFSSYEGTTNFYCTLRIGPADRADITMSFTNFSPSIGGVVGHPGFQFRCTGSTSLTMGQVTFCGVTNAARAGTSYTLLRFRAEQMAGLYFDRSIGGVKWWFPNRPSFQTGTYSSTVTFTISSV